MKAEYTQKLILELENDEITDLQDLLDFLVKQELDKIKNARFIKIIEQLQEMLDTN